MAKVKKEKEAGKEAKNPIPKGFKPRAKMSDEERLAKKKARLEAIKNRPHVQRPNSRQVDIIELENGGKVMNFAALVRNYGSIITSVALDKDGNVVSTSITTVKGLKPKVKKGHGSLALLGGSNDVDFEEVEREDEAPEPESEED